jgi:hypothetical protein
MPALAGLIFAPVMFASLPGQTQTINVLSTAKHDCVDMTVRPAYLGGHLYKLNMNVPDRCAGCRIQDASARIVFDIDYCHYRVRFVSARSSESIRIRESSHTVILKGTDERALHRLFALMCQQGGVPLPIGRPIKLEQEVDGIAIEFAGGMPARIEAPLPMSAWVSASDTCGHHGSAIIPLSPCD